MTAETLALIAAYFLCSEAAEVRVLPPAEAAACVDIYTDVKLSFVDGVDRDGYDGLSTPERAEVNRIGYAGYVAWRARNPALVAQMKRDAQKLIADESS
ncbi:hypothetical protein [uncultured Roseobacter sp.]|uniref:hypothetical protein n=1 Tax=uncultured Roseobacter sp. TaxID=114847 RepID=UPI002621C566|nr:hypothetical protein [uncultured Roseobacter sp.]